MTTSRHSVPLRARLVGLYHGGRILRLTPFETTTAEGRSDERFRRAGLTATTSAAAKGIALVTTAVSVPLTLNYLGSERFGLWMTLSALVAFLGFTDLGIGNSLLNNVAHAAGRNDRTLIRANVSSGIAMLLAVAVGFALLFAFAYGRVPWAHLFNVTSATATEEAGPAAAVLVGCFLANLPISALPQVRFGLQQGYVNSMFVGIGNIAGLVLLVIATHMQLGLPWLVLAMAGAPVLATLVNGFALAAQSPWIRPTFRDVDSAVVRTLLRIGLLFLVLQLAAAVAFTSNSLILAAMLGPSAVADYAVVSKLFLIPTLLVGLAVSPLWPAYREAIGRGDLAWVRRTFDRSVRMSLSVAGSTSVLLVLLGLPIIAAWVGTSTIQPSFGLVLAIGMWTTLAAVGNAVAMLLNGAQVMRFQVVIATTMAAANIMLSVALTSQIGVSGVVWGSVVAFTLVELVPVAFYLPRLFTRLESRPGQAHDPVVS